MSTLAEIESALESLPLHEQEALYARLSEGLHADGKRAATRLEVLTILQERLALDADKVRAWQTAARAARR